MDIPVVTDEQRKRFEAEFAEYWDTAADGPTLSRDADRTDLEAMWVTCSAYREMQTTNLLGVAGCSHEWKPAEVSYRIEDNAPLVYKRSCVRCPAIQWRLGENGPWENEVVNTDVN